jgi:hypothetical protein
MPTSGSLTDWLRTEASKPFEQPRGDVGDQFPLQWLTVEMNKNVHLEHRVATAVEALLGEGNETVTSHLLSMAQGAAPVVRSAVMRAIGDHGSLLGGMSVIQSTRSGLGEAVWVTRGDLAEPVPAKTLDVLQQIQRPEDGWPDNIRVGVHEDWL